MYSKIYEKIKKFIKNNYKFLIIEILIVAIFLIPTGYIVYSPGGLINIDDRIEIKGDYTKQGSINATYVTTRNGIVINYLLAKILPSWELEKKEKRTLKGEEFEDSLKRDRLAYKYARDNAIMLAYEKADKEIKIKNTKLYIIAVDKKLKTKLKVGDHILEIDNIKIDSRNNLKKALKDKKVGDIVKIKVKRDKKIIKEKIKLVEKENEAVIGIYVMDTRTFKVNPKIVVKQKDTESGSSAGLMTSLSIYNKLIPTDITKGLTISGTGTIDEKGKVGPIDGVKFKLKGAVKKHADVFLVPEKNYEEAIKEQKKHKYKIKIIKVKTFNQALKELNKI